MIILGKLIGCLLNCAAIALSLYIFSYLKNKLFTIVPGKTTNEKLRVLLKRLSGPINPNNNISRNTKREGLKPISECFGFWVSILLPLSIGLFILGLTGLLSTVDSEPLVTSQGLTNWAKQNAFSLTIMSLSGPIAAIYISNHRSEQQLILFDIQNQQNRFNNHYKKEELFVEAYQKEFVESFQNGYDKVPFELSSPKIVLRNIFAGAENLEFISSDKLERYISTCDQLIKYLELPHANKDALNCQHAHEMQGNPIYRATNTHSLLTVFLHLISLNVIKLDIFENLEKVPLQDLLKVISTFNKFLSGNLTIYCYDPIQSPKDYSTVYIHELTKKLQLKRTIKDTMMELGVPDIEERGFHASALITNRHYFYSFQSNDSTMTDYQRTLSDKLIDANKSLKAELMERYNQN